jgi:hypothetical protein
MTECRARQMTGMAGCKTRKRLDYQIADLFLKNELR